MHKHHTRLGEPLGSGCSHIVLIDFVQHETSKQTRIGGNADHQAQQDRQRRIGADVFPVVVAPTLHWKPTQAVGQHILSQNDEDQNTDGHQGGKHDHGAAVNRRASDPSKPQGQNQSNDCFNQEQRCHQSQRSG